LSSSITRWGAIDSLNEVKPLGVGEHHGPEVASPTEAEIVVGPLQALIRARSSTGSNGFGR
jgi:hypothetical protein